MVNRLLSISLSAFAIAAFAGCGEPEPSGHDNGTYTANLNSWNPESVKLKCPSGDCPEGVGAVVFAQPTSEGFRLQRCTATLIGPDRFMTNSHCGKSIRYDRAYLFLLRAGETARFPVQSRIFDREDGAGIEAGMGPDLAIFTLKDNVTGIRPRRVGRRIPGDIKELTGFKINEPGQAKFQNFSLEKDKCTTIPKQALFGGGSEERNVGLALFGCTIVRGNSGAPLFANGNWDDVQVVVNSSYPFQSGSGKKGVPVLSKLESLFETKPLYFSENFAMGNRVHCMEIDGLPSPESVCSRARVDSEIRRQFESTMVKIYRDRLNEMNSDPNVIWGLRVYEVKVMRNSTDANPRPGIVMIPYPVCVRSEAPRGELGAQQVQYVALAMDASGEVSGSLQKAQTVKARYFKISSVGEYQVSFDRDWRAELSFQYPGSSITEPEDSGARKMLTQTAAQVGRCSPDERPLVRRSDVAVLSQADLVMN